MSNKRPVAPEGYTQPSTQMTVRGGGEPSGISAKNRLMLGGIWCFVGSAFLPLAPVVANVLVAFGAVIVMAGTERRVHFMTLLCALLAGGLASYALIGLTDLPMVMVSVCVAFLMADAMVKGNLSAGRMIVAAVLASLVMLSADAFAAYQQGTTVTKVVETVVNEAVEANLSSVDLEGTAVLLETRDSLVAYWPTMYFAVGLSVVVCAFAGAWLAARTSTVGVKMGMIARYDVPLWVAIAFAVGVAVQLIGPRLPLWQNETTTVGANVVMCARIVLAQQGLSVLQWWMRERRVAPPLRMFIILSAVWLELSFALTSVLGLLDVGLNFRHIERNRADLLPMPSRER